VLAEDEILKYRMDISDVEATAQRLNELLEQIRAKREQGEDTSELERQVTKELDAVGKVTSKEKEAAGATEELVKQKERLGSTVRMLGGRFSGFLGDLGGVIELLIQGGKHAIAFAAGLAGITVAIAAVQRLKRALEEATKAQEDLNQKTLEYKATAIQQGTSLADQLLAMGASERFDDAARMATSLVKQWGLSPAAAEQAAGMATVLGLSGTEAGMLAVAQIQGAPVGTMKQAGAYIGEMTPETATYLLGQLEAYARTPAAELRRRIGQLPGAVGLGARFRDPEMLYQALKEQGALPEGIGSYADFRRHFEAAQHLVAQSEAEYLKEAVRLGRPVEYKGFGGGLGKPSHELAEAQRLLSLLEETPSGAAPADTRWSPEAGGGVPQILIQHNERIGTQFNTKDRRRLIGHPTHGAVTVGGSNFGRTNHGM
jgi:hypothetical protein